MKNIIATAVFLALTAFASVAFANHPDLDVVFKALEAEVGKQGMTVTYKIAPNSWRDLKAAGIAPQLVIWEQTHDGRVDFRYAADLRDRVGVLKLPRELRVDRGDHLLVEVGGRNGFSHVATTTFGERCGPKIPLDLGSERHGSSHGHHNDPPADNEHDHGRADHVKDKVDAAKVVEACGRASQFNPAKCIQLAALLERPDAVQTVEACDAHTQWDSDLHRCLEAAAGVRRDAAGTVRACGAATQWASDLNACITAAAAHVEPARDVEACAAHTQWTSELKQCLTSAEPLGRRASSVIDACGRTTQWASELNACIREAKALRRG